MEFMIQWFFALKFAIAAIVIYFGYKLAIKKEHTKFNYIVVILCAILLFISPVKLDVNTKAQTDRNNNHIKQTKILQPKIEDNSFKQSVDANLGISDEDLK